MQQMLIYKSLLKKLIQLIFKSNANKLDIDKLKNIPTEIYIYIYIYIDRYNIYIYIYIYIYIPTLYGFLKMSYIKIKQKDIHKISEISVMF